MSLCRNIFICLSERTTLHSFLYPIGSPNGKVTRPAVGRDSRTGQSGNEVFGITRNATPLRSAGGSRWMPGTNRDQGNYLRQSAFICGSFLFSDLYSRQFVAQNPCPFAVPIGSPSRRSLAGADPFAVQISPMRIHAANRSPSFVASSGTSNLHAGTAKGQRGWKLQPTGGFRGDGGSPCKIMR